MVTKYYSDTVMRWRGPFTKIKMEIDQKMFLVLVQTVLDQKLLAFLHSYSSAYTVYKVGTIYSNLFIYTT